MQSPTLSAVFSSCVFVASGCASPSPACCDAQAPGASSNVASEAQHCDSPSPPNLLLSNFEAEDSEQAWYQFGEGVSLRRSSDPEATETGFSADVEFAVSTGGAGIGLPLGSPGCPLNASHALGVRFSARGAGPLRISVGDVLDLPLSEGGDCTRSGESCYDFPGFPIQLTDSWQTFEVPFCRMQPEGWGQQTRAPDPSRLMALQFRHQPGAKTRFQLDEVSLYPPADSGAAPNCAPACPMDAVANPEAIVPGESYLKLTDALTLHTFDQDTPHCGKITRRYLQYRPTRLTHNSNAPIVFALHGRESNAEGFQDFMTHGSFDERAEQSGAIVVYGNAAPGAQSSANPNFHNTGTWRQGANDDGQVDDIEYLRQVLADMKRRGSIEGGNAVYLVGHSSGGGLAVDAAFAAPELFVGVAPLFAYVGEREPAVPASTPSSVQQVLLAYAPDDPGLPAGHGERLRDLSTAWATQLGVDGDVIAQPPTKQLPNPVVEGKDYTGSLTVALATRDSSVTQLDLAARQDAARIRILRIEGGGHFLPHPVQDTEPAVLEQWGFRNQDLRIVDAIWDFFFPAAATP